MRTSTKRVISLILAVCLFAAIGGTVLASHNNPEGRPCSGSTKLQHIGSHGTQNVLTHTWNGRVCTLQHLIMIHGSVCNLCSRVVSQDQGSPCTEVHTICGTQYPCKIV
jgi:hypothetical protein